MQIEELVQRQRAFYSTGTTLPVEFRMEALRKLKAEIRAMEPEIDRALEQDLGKSGMESYMCEVGMTLSELSDLLAHTPAYFRPHRAATPLAQFHASSFTLAEPYGVVLVMSPWNYPFMLTLEPLLGAIACGNCCVVKPSAYAPNTSAVIKKLIERCFPPEYVAVVEGGRQENQALLNQRFDYIFFTGGQKVGTEVLRHAAEYLTPVTLELGGKSPCVVDHTAKLDLAAKRIAFGKLLNCGQTCVAPDYFLVEGSVEAEFIEKLKTALEQMAGKEPLKNKDYVHMVSRKHYDRVMGLIDREKVVYGGRGDPESLGIEPTILRNVTQEDPVMQEEIFGPLLPILPVADVEEAMEIIKSREKPLACYLFTEDRRVQDRFLRQVPFGGGCINDTVIHLATSHMGFGGVGASGMGSYHGKKSLETFSHSKSIVRKSTWMDLPIRYAPYTRAKEALLKLFLR